MYEGTGTWARAISDTFLFENMLYLGYAVGNKRGLGNWWPSSFQGWVHTCLLLCQASGTVGPQRILSEWNKKQWEKKKKKAMGLGSAQAWPSS